MTRDLFNLYIASTVSPRNVAMGESLRTPEGMAHGVDVRALTPKDCPITRAVKSEGRRLQAATLSNVARGDAVAVRRHRRRL